jgi:hypothetical protein
MDVRAESKVWSWLVDFARLDCCTQTSCGMSLTTLHAYFSGITRLHGESVILWFVFR